MNKDDDGINPWLTIPASDYESHMDSPDVGQLRFLNEIFRDLLAEFRPQRLSVVGCTTGNGFEHIDFAVTKNVYAIDINADYLSVLRRRFPANPDRLITIREDVNACELEPGSLDLVHCALIFEYVDPAETIRTISNWLTPGGIMSVVLQLRDEKLAAVSDTGYRSLKRLDSILNLVDREEFKKIIISGGLSVIREEVRKLKSGKSFYLSINKRAEQQRLQ